jgi:hypothetical protein
MITGKINKKAKRCACNNTRTGHYGHHKSYAACMDDACLKRQLGSGITLSLSRRQIFLMRIERSMIMQNQYRR